MTAIETPEILTRNGIEVVETTVGPRAKVTCDRCGGTGRFSHCEQWGSRCFDCDVASGGKNIGFQFIPVEKAVKRLKRSEAIARRVAKNAAEREERLRALDLRIDVDLADVQAAGVEFARRQEEARRAAQKFIGKPGERMTFVARLSFVTDFQSSYGVRVLCRFDADGSAVVWWTTWSAFPGDLRKGDLVEVTATIKAHGEYKGNKQTEVSRLKLVRVVEAAPEE
jgi:hypothetical protein